MAPSPFSWTFSRGSRGRVHAASCRSQNYSSLEVHTLRERRFISDRQSGVSDLGRVLDVGLWAPPTTLLDPKRKRNLLLGGAQKLKWNLLTLKRERKRGRRLLLDAASAPQTFPPADVRNNTARTETPPAPLLKMVSGPKASSRSVEL